MYTAEVFTRLKLKLTNKKDNDDAEVAVGVGVIRFQAEGCLVIG